MFWCSLVFRGHENMAWRLWETAPMLLKKKKKSGSRRLGRLTIGTKMWIQARLCFPNVPYKTAPVVKFLRPIALTISCVCVMAVSVCSTFSVCQQPTRCKCAASSHLAAPWNSSSPLQRSTVSTDHMYTLSPWFTETAASGSTCVSARYSCNRSSYFKLFHKICNKKI